MQSKRKTVFKRLLTATLAVTLAVSLAVTLAAGFQPTAAWANEPIPEMPDIASLQDKVDEASAVYDEANRKIAEIEVQITATGKRVEEISREIPAAKKKSDEAAVEYYRLMSTSNMFLDLIFSSTTMGEFFANLEYTLRMNQNYLNNIGLLSNLKGELQAAQSSLESDKKALEYQRIKAEEALQDAQYNRDVAEEEALRIAELTAQATAAAAAAAEAAAAAAGQPQIPTLPPNGGGGTAEPPNGNNQSTDKQTFVNEWSGRIDAYLSGSPMAGTGMVFANAAWDYNVDPRWSPAIACLESSKGRYCFKPYNAWGWGSSSWDSWETAIYAHVGGLSRGYGYTISVEAAYKYCPPNADYWFSFVSGQMALI